MNQPANKVEYLSSLPSHTVRVQVGDVCCGISCSDSKVFRNLYQLHTNFLSEKPADINIQLEIVDRLDFAEVETALLHTRMVTKGNHFAATELTLEGEFDTTNCTLSMTVEKHLFDPGLELKLMNRVLSSAYYTVCKAKYSGTPPAFLVHASGIVRHGQALLFSGPSEIGKTTIARLCDEKNGQVLNDEMVLVWRPHQTGDVFKVQGVPIIGGFPQRLNATAPLRCVFLLKQSKKTAVHPLDRTDAYLRFMRQIITPADFMGQTDKQASLSLMSEFSDEVTRVTPFYELEFTLNKALLWQVVGELERTLEKEEHTR